MFMLLAEERHLVLRIVERSRDVSRAFIWERLVWHDCWRQWGYNLRRRIEGVCEILEGWQHSFYRTKMLKSSWLIYGFGGIWQCWPLC